MRISDWSSDVCSSDLPEKAERRNEYQRTWRARQIKASKKTREQPLYLTSGKLWCARHDTAFVFRRSRLHGCPEKGCANQNLPHDYLMPLILAELRKFGPDQVDLYYREQETRRNALLQELGQLEPQRKSVQQEIRSLLTTIARLERGPENLAHLQNREKESGRTKHDIDRPKVETIGRASCRDRVYQTAKIAGVAVSVNK